MTDEIMVTLRIADVVVERSVRLEGLREGLAMRDPALLLELRDAAYDHLAHELAAPGTVLPSEAHDFPKGGKLRELVSELFGSLGARQPRLR
jgi:hypothetical protein